MLKPTMKIHNNAEDDVVHNDNDVYLHMMNHHDEDDTAVRNDSEDCLNCSCRRGAHILVYARRTAGGGFPEERRFYTSRTLCGPDAGRVDPRVLPHRAWYSSGTTCYVLHM